MIVSETVQKFLLDYIRTRVKVGDKLPSEREIAKMLKVGRSSVREALQSMCDTGIIEKRPGKGNYLRQEIDTNLTTVVKRLLPTFDIESSLDFLEFRRGIETENAYLAAQRMTEQSIDVLKMSLVDLKDCIHKGQSIIVPDLTFHNTIAHATQNKVMIHVYDSLIDYFKKVRIEMAINDDVENAVQYHTELLNAIEDRDSNQASLLMRKHIEDVQQHYQKMITEINPKLRGEHVAT
ncbi:FadR/GntR family transcriptional regulator [Sporolactobacillus kofuensis]|uniref:FadR/GntR family transcriptional regulator n=1 Tax=Sporolactobacillus kofuensis TaxID=269672 RepID=A0ABW1WGZ2_9BACL|nr:FadR/GntR family transcriptional regulator [Sporolactobacillus kofuensis]MCO7175813.1 FadR family transcriptional regulator [Sporolactobacillus kofuensis]